MVVESGEINPTSNADKKSTPEMLATKHNHVLLARLIRKLKNDKNVNWSTIAHSSTDEFINLQKVAFLNDDNAIREIIKNDEHGVLIGECCKTNKKSCNALMTAAEFSSNDVLQELLQYLLGMMLEAEARDPTS